MPTTVGIVLLVLIFVGIIVTLIALWLRAQVRWIRAEWTARGLTFRKGPQWASYQGHEHSTIPLRGNGLVALTGTDLRFMQIVPRREFVIPLAQITGIEQHRTWKRHYNPGRPVMVVHYGSGEQADAIGLMLRDTPDWQEAVTAAAHLSPVPDEF